MLLAAKIMVALLAISCIVAAGMRISIGLSRYLGSRGPSSTIINYKLFKDAVQGILGRSKAILFNAIQSIKTKSKNFIFFCSSYNHAICEVNGKIINKVFNFFFCVKAIISDREGQVLGLVIGRFIFNLIFGTGGPSGLCLFTALPLMVNVSSEEISNYFYVLSNHDIAEEWVNFTTPLAELVGPSFEVMFKTHFTMPTTQSIWYRFVGLINPQDPDHFSGVLCGFYTLNNNPLDPMSYSGLLFPEHGKPIHEGISIGIGNYGMTACIRGDQIGGVVSTLNENLPITMRIGVGTATGADLCRVPEGGVPVIKYHLWDKDGFMDLMRIKYYPIKSESEISSGCLSTGGQSVYTVR